jgi:hypothetical protein
VAAPSLKLFAVATARPSFQKSSTIDPMSNATPKSAPTNELPMRPKTDWLVTSVITFAMVNALTGRIKSRKKKVNGREAPKCAADFYVLICPKFVISDTKTRG